MPPYMLRGIRRRFRRLSPCDRQVVHALRTLSPVAGFRIATEPLPLDLHVLGLPLAFILSQDQTLRCIFYSLNPWLSRNQLYRSFCFGTCFLY